MPSKAGIPAFEPLPRSGRGARWQPARQAARQALGLTVDRVKAQVVIAPVEMRPAGLAALAAVLSDEERARVERLRQAADRQRFTTAHGLLRAVLGTHMACDPAAVALTRKPSGQWICDRPGVHLSLAHAGGQVAVAVADAAVGIDIEVHGATDGLELARDWFSPSEYAAITRAPADEVSALFLQFWTAKEAVLKAAGTGFSVAMADFSILAPTSEPQAVSFLKPTPQLADLAVASIPAPAGYAAALCMPIGPWSVDQWHDDAVAALARSRTPPVRHA